MSAQLSERSKEKLEEKAQFDNQVIEVVDFTAVNKRLKVRLEVNQIPIGRITRYTNVKMLGKDFVKGHIINNLAKALNIKQTDYSSNSLVDLRAWVENNGGTVEYKFGIYAGMGNDTYEITMPNFTDENLIVVANIQSWNDIGGEHEPKELSPEEEDFEIVEYEYQYISTYINGKFWDNLRAYYPNDEEMYLDTSSVSKIADMFELKKQSFKENYIEILPWILKNGGKAQIKNPYSDYGKELDIIFHKK